MSREANTYLVTLVEVAEQAGWGCEGALQYLKIKPATDWAGRPAVTPSDATRIMKRAIEERDAWTAGTFADWAAEREGQKKAAEEARASKKPRRRSLGPAGGITTTDFPGMNE